MRITTLNQIFGMLAVTATLCGAETALAQHAAAPPSMKTIGTPTAPAKPEIVPSLFVLNSRGATLQGDTLTLTGVTASAIIFADRPVRSAGHQPTADVIAEWGSGDARPACGYYPIHPVTETRRHGARDARGQGPGDRMPIS